MTLYGQDIRMAYMDVPAQGQPNGRTVVLFHGMNFAGFYWGGPIDALRKEGFRVVVPDQIGFGRSSKPIIPYNFHDMARNTRLLLQHLKIDKAFIVGHSMGGMLAARFATQYPDVAERVVIYNPIGLLDPRYERPWGSIDEAYKRNLGTTYQQIHAGIFRYFSHNPSAWKPEFDKYPKIRYAWTLSADWPRYAMVQALLGQMTYLDPVVHDWAHIKAPTLVFGGAEDSLAGPASVFQARMKFIADTIPNGNGKLHPHSGPRPRAALRGAGKNVSAADRVSQGRADVEMNLTNATALVTGGSSGIGLAIAKALADAGSRVAITGRNQNRLNEAAKAIGAHPIKADVSSEDDVKRTYREFFDRFGHLDILVNNAAFGERRALVDMDRAKFDAILQTNVMGTMLMSREAAKHFVERKSGNLINIASTAGVRGAANGTSYYASKFARARYDGMLARRAAAAQRPGHSSSTRAKCSPISRPPPASRRTTTTRRSCRPKTSRTW